MPAQWLLLYVLLEYNDDGYCEIYLITKCRKVCISF